MSVQIRMKIFWDIIKSLFWFLGVPAISALLMDHFILEGSWGVYFAWCLGLLFVSNVSYMMLKKIKSETSEYELDLIMDKIKRESKDNPKQK